MTGRKNGNRGGKDGKIGCVKSAKTALTLLVLFAGLLLRGEAAAVTNAADLARSTLAEDGPRFSFDLPARLTHVLANRADGVVELAVEDDTGAAVVFGPAWQLPPDLVPGSRIRMTGKSAVGNNTIPLFSDIAPAGRGPAPALREASCQEVLSGACDWRPVRVSGTVRDVFYSELNPDWVVLVVSDRDVALSASTPATGLDLSQIEALTDARVSIAGVCLPRDGSSRRHVGRVFHFAGMSALQVLTPGTKDPFDKPPLDDLEQLSPAELARLGRHRATGRVLSSWPGGNVLLKTARGRIVHVELAKDVRPAAGSYAEVAGFPESNLYCLNLTRAIWREAPALDIPPERVRGLSAREIRHAAEGRSWFDPAFHGRRVRMRGVVRGVPGPENPGTILHVEDGAFLFPVEIGAVSNLLGRVEANSTIEITGTCVMDTENWKPNMVFPQIKGFTVVVDDPAGIRVLARPPWWTTGRLMGVIGILLAALGGIFAWNRALNRLAERRGRELLQAQIGEVQADLKKEERTRLAVELHDALAQSITGASMQIDAAYDLRGEAPEEMLDHLEFAAKTLKSCRDELRNCLWDLRSQALEETDMTRAVLRTLQPHLGDVQFTARFNVPRKKFSDNTAHAVLCIVRELVVNALHHGKATEIRVAGSDDADAIRFSVRDNGLGFTPGECPGVLQGHFGLQGIRERVAKLGGHMEIESAPGRGTRISIGIPHPEDIP